MKKESPGDIDWIDGSWTNGRIPSYEAEIIITGDWAPIRAFDKIIEESPESIYGDLLPVLRKGDLRITNLESALFGETPIHKSGAVFKGRPAHIKGLTTVPFDVVTLANNHVFDYGREAFLRTVELLKKSGIKHLGAGKSEEESAKPLILDLKGVRIGIVNFSEGEDGLAAKKGPGVFGWEINKVAGTVRKLKKAVNVVLVIGHCGVEYIAFPPPYVTDAFKLIADAGADLIVGHHPHVPQGVQIYRNTPICYSLGNFVFYQETELVHRKTGYLIKAGVSKSGISHVKLVPYEIGADSLNILKGKKRDGFMDSLRQVSVPLSDENNIRDAWNAFLRYYGIKGFQEEIRMIMKKFEDEPQKGAAMFRNRIATMQHNRHWIDALTRITDGTIDSSPEWAFALQAKWLTEKR